MWLQDLTALSISSDNVTYPWLQHNGLLSAALQKCCVNLTVQVLSQKIANVFAYEQDALQLDNLATCWVRQVYICGDGAPWVFARVVAPLATYLKYQHALDSLGNNLLGPAFLSKQPNVARSNFKFATIAETIHEKCASEQWARQSIFDIDGYELLLTEIFLSTIPRYPG